MNTSYEKLVKRYVTEHSSHCILPRKAASCQSPGQSSQPPILISAGWTRSDHPVKQSQPPAHSWKLGSQVPQHLDGDRHLNWGTQPSQARWDTVTGGQRPREEGNPAGKEKQESGHARKQTLPVPVSEACLSLDVNLSTCDIHSIKPVHVGFQSPAIRASPNRQEQASQNKG